MAGTKAQVLQEAQIAIQFVAQRDKGAIRRGQQGTVTGFTLYSAKVACDLCERAHQPERQVQLSVGDRTIRAGLSCLHQVTGIGESALQTAAKGQISIALKARGLAQQLGNESVTFETVQQVLDRIRRDAAEILQGTRHAERTLAEIEELAQRFTERKVTRADETQLNTIFDYLSYLSDARQRPERHQARVQALRGDPWARKERLNGPVLALPLDAPEELTPGNVALIKKILAEVARLQSPALHTSAVDPREYATRDEYLQALQEHYQRLVQRGEALRPNLQAQYDLVHFSPGGKMREIDVLAGLSLPCVTPVYDHPSMKHLNLDGASARELLARRHQVYTVESCACGRATMGQIRIDSPQWRNDDRGRERPAHPENYRMVDIWYVAYWIPDSWSGMFPLWREHGGREALLAFPIPE